MRAPWVRGSERDFTWGRQLTWPTLNLHSAVFPPQCTFLWHSYGNAAAVLHGTAAQCAFSVTLTAMRHSEPFLESVQPEFLSITHHNNPSSPHIFQRNFRKFCVQFKEQAAGAPPLPRGLLSKFGGYSS